MLYSKIWEEAHSNRFYERGKNKRTEIIIAKKKMKHRMIIGDFNKWIQY